MNFSAAGDTIRVPAASKAAYEADTDWRNTFTAIPDTPYYRFVPTANGSRRDELLYALHRRKRITTEISRTLQGSSEKITYICTMRSEPD